MATNVKPNGGIIYLMTNLVNGKYYVGQTKNLRIRINQHLCAGRPGKAQFPVSKAIAKYGRESFTFDVIGSASDQPSLDNLEALWITVLSSTVKGYGYNRRLGGGGSSCCPETRHLQSIAKKGKPSPKKGTGWQTREGARQNKLEYARRKRAEAKAARDGKGKPRRRWTEEERRMLSEAHKGLPGNRKGQPVSEETRAKLRASWQRKRDALPPKPPKVKRILTPEQYSALVARVRSPDVRAKISQGKLGCKRPDNAARVGVMFTAEANAKRKATMTRYFSLPEGKAHTQKAFNASLGRMTTAQRSDAGRKGAMARWGKSNAD